MKNTILIPVFLGLLLFAGCEIEKSPFKDAVWSISGDSKTNEIELHGLVSLGEPLLDEERKASFARGGNGKIIEFKGGWINAGQGKDNSLNFGGYEFTLHIRLKVPDGKWDNPIISKYGSREEFSWSLYGYSFGHDPEQKEWEFTKQNYWPFGAEDGTGYALEFKLGVYTEPLFLQSRPSRYDDPNIMDGIFRVGVPVSMIGADNWHDVTVRFTGPKLELFVDGVLVDEEWPIGKLRISSASCLIGALEKNGAGVSEGFNGNIDYAAIWDRSLSNDEIILLSGGKEAVALAERKILGPDNKCLQYWRPRGHNTWVGDVMPAFDKKNDCLHLFWLFDRRHGGSGWGVGKHQFAHASTNDLINWEHHPLAVPITYQYETFGTGVPVIKDKHMEIHYGLHTRRMLPNEATTQPILEDNFKSSGKYIPLDLDKANEQWPETKVPIGHGVAVSQDDINFHKTDINLTPAQNLWIFKEPKTDQFYMTWSKNLLFSKDLRQWTLINEDFLPVGKQTEYDNSGECPNYFEWNGWHYIIMGVSGFWMSRDAIGPYWEGRSGENLNKVTFPRWNIYDGLCVPMVAPFKNNRRLLAGWIKVPMPHNNWGGYLIFRELIQYEDGTLGMKWPEEMIPPSGTPLKWEIVSPSEVINQIDQTVSIESIKFSEVEIGSLPNSYHFSALVIPGAKVEAFGINVKETNNRHKGCELRMEPALKHVQWGTSVDASLSDFVPYVKNRSKNAPGWGYDFAIENVEGLNIPFKLDLIVKYDPNTKITLVDACIDKKRTMVTARYDLKGNSLFLFVKGGEIIFSDIKIQTLNE